MRTKMTGSLSFTVTSDAKSGGNTKQFDLQVGNVIRIGRSPAVDFAIEHRGVSQYHAEFKVISEDGKPKLCIRDLSSNGTGLKRQDADAATCLQRDKDEPVPDGSVLLVPMRLKENHSGRAWLTVSMGGGAAKKSKKAKVREASEAKSGEGSGEEKDEAARKAFVELLLKTRDINGSSKYEQAEKLLGHEDAWKACPTTTRKECFNIFVEHLGDAAGKKKDKKKKDKKDGKKKESSSKKKRAASGSGSASRPREKRRRRRAASSGSN